MANVINMFNCGAKGLQPIIRAYAPSGSTLTCDGQSYTLRASEEYHDFVVKAETTNMLPDGYTGLEYIQSSGTQYIDTGIAFSSNIGTINCGFSNFTTGCLFGTYDGSTRSPLLVYNSGTFNSQAGNTLSAKLTADTLYHDSSFICKNGSAQFSLSDGIQTTFSYTPSISTSTTSSIFSIHRTDSGSAGYSEFAVARVYYCAYYVNDILVRNFIPCKNASNEVGMYDTVSKTFFGNSGTGTFIAGPNKEWTVYKTYTVTATNNDKTSSRTIKIDRIALYTILLL